MKIRILRSTVCGGRHVDVGEVVDASDRDSGILMRAGKAEAVQADKAPVAKKKASKKKAQAQTMSQPSLPHNAD